MTVSDETLTLRKSMNMRASLESFAFSHSKTAISFNILLVLMILYLRNMYIFRSQITICMIHNITNAVPCYYLWYGVIYTNDSIPTKNWHWENLWICERAERAILFFFFLHFHILKLLFPSIFCWYFWYFISETVETYIFSGLKLQSAWYIYTCIINAVPCYYLWYGVIPTKHWRWEICERARSERAWTFLHFHILKLLFPSIFCWYFWYFISETYIYFRSVRLKLQSAWYIYHQCSSLFLLMVWRYIYKRKYTDKTLTLKKNLCIYASERSERD